ncbi:MAG: hypothetical protein CSA62_08580 [Planctomycetota bacterium]|nr:MAG: hypothetical protein CSA62_08580 [Planctomycetota bacterium]
MKKRLLLALASSLLACACASRLSHPSWVQQKSYPEPEDSIFDTRHRDFLAGRDWRPEQSVEVYLQYVPSIGLEGRSQDATIFEMGTRLRKRQAIGPDSQWIYGADLGFTALDFDGGGVGSGELVRIGGEFGIAHFFREDLYVEASLLPEVRTSLGTSLSLDCLFFDIEALGTWRYREGVYFDGGLAITEEFGDTKLLPLLGMRMIVDANWRVEVLLPRKIEISWREGEKTTLYGGWYRWGSEYRVGDSFLANAPEHDLFLDQQRIAVGVDYWLTDAVRGWVEAGLVVNGNVEMRPSRGGGFEGGWETDPFLRVGFAWDL